MVETELSDDVRGALIDVQRYLLDQIPPLTAAESIETLMGQPPELLMRLIRAWAIEQSRVQTASMCDFLFHALRKVYVVSSLKLIDRAALEPYLERVIPLAMQVCPVDERDTLRTYLSSLRDSRTLMNAPVNIVGLEGREKPVPGPPAPLSGDEAARNTRRFSLVIDRLSRYFRPGAASPAANLVQEQPMAQLMTMAAVSSSSEEDLERYIETLKPYIGSAQSDNLFRLLAENVPSWEINATPPEGTKAPASIEAMHKILALTRNPLEATKRIRELLMSAIEQFNKGALAGAASMLELAESVIAEKKIDASSVERLRADVVETISSEQLKKYAENRARHPLLRRILGAFPTLTTGSLFDQLRGEERPERRRSLLGLLEAWGNYARETALKLLEAELSRPAAEVDTYYLRNLIYLLHKIPREGDEGLEKEIALLTRATARGQSIYVIKEAMLPLGQLKNDATVKLLTMRLAEFEAILVRKDTSLYPMDEMQKLLDRITVALVRIGTPAALLTVARHGMKPNPLLGDTRARLAALSQYDLSFDEQTVDVILNAIREDLPARLLGRVLPQRQPPPMKLIEALSGTRSERVESLFAEIAEKFADHDVGRAAAAAHESVTSGAEQAVPTRDSGATLTGDLQFFGLPSLMQSLAETQATGVVTLSSKERGHTSGKLLFLNGKFIDAQATHLRGVDALYQLLERPIVGTFAFVPQPPDTLRGRNEQREVVPLLFEGIRRHDELKHIAVLIPDDLCLKSTAVKPTADPEESDPGIIREVWVKAVTGKRIGDWEPEVTADAYRVRRLISRWLEEGALEAI